MQSSWMLTTKPMLCASVIKRKCYKKIDLRVCPGLVKPQANSTTVWKHAWFVKADSLPLLALQLQSIWGGGRRGGEKEAEKWDDSLSIWKHKIQKRSVPQCFWSSGYAAFSYERSSVDSDHSHVWAICKSVKIPDFIGFVLQWKVYSCIIQLSTYIFN